MNKRSIIKKYFEILFSNNNLDELSTIFSKNLKFRGPFYQFNSAKAYIESLKANPPTDFKYQIIDIFEKENKVAVFYIFSKGDIKTPMAQFFELEENLIVSILLIFDTSVFT